jgi:flavin reductase (DIM6/NTAB) family NADH-FMN oxidoreductase RutF
MQRCRISASSWSKTMTTPAEPIPLQLRQALRRLAKAVVVITVRHSGQRFAMAATAVSELAMDPPSMLICVNRSASLHLPLSEGARFCINILHSSHQEIANACSGVVKGEARFATGLWRESEHGVPFLADSQASIVCMNDLSVEYGTHRVYMGQVVEVLTDREVDPLVYVDGRYTVVVGQAAPEPDMS